MTYRMFSNCLSRFSLISFLFETIIVQLKLDTSGIIDYLVIYGGILNSF